MTQVQTHPRWTVLVAEDNDNDVCLIQRAFRKSFITVRLHIARDGEEAIAYLKGELSLIHI